MIPGLHTRGNNNSASWLRRVSTVTLGSACTNGRFPCFALNIPGTVESLEVRARPPFVGVRSDDHFPEGIIHVWVG